MSKTERRGKIFLDYLRNDRANSAIRPYSTRARQGAPVAVPLRRDELGALESAAAYTIRDVPRRLEAPTRHVPPSSPDVTCARNRVMRSLVVRRSTQEAMAVPYDRIRDLPRSVRDNLPEHAQDIYRKAFNSAWEQYEDPADRRGSSDREETAHRVAWSAVKEVYEKNGNGDWVRKND